MVFPSKFRELLTKTTPPLTAELLLNMAFPLILTLLQDLAQIPPPSPLTELPLNMVLLTIAIRL